MYLLRCFPSSLSNSFSIIFLTGQLIIPFAVVQAQSLPTPATPSMQACIDADGRSTLTDQACPPGTQAQARGPGLASPKRTRPVPQTLSPEQRARWAAELQVALEAKWQKEVEVRPDATGLTVHNRTRRDVFWFITPDAPLAWVPLSLNNRIAPGTTRRFDGADTQPGEVYRFYWWYKGPEIEPGSGIYGPDYVRKVLVQMRGAPVSGSESEPGAGGRAGTGVAAGQRKPNPNKGLQALEPR